MELISLSLAFRYVEIVIDIINIGIYYGTGTKFTLEDPLNNKSYESGDNYGQAVLIMFFILALAVCAASVVLEAEKRFTIFIMGYNAVAIVFFFIAGIIILSTWSPLMFDYDDNNDLRSGGLAVGSFCIIQCAVLAVGTFFIFKQKSE